MGNSFSSSTSILTTDGALSLNEVPLKLGNYGQRINFDVRTLGTRACQELEVVFAKVEPSQLETPSASSVMALAVKGLMMDARYGNMK